MSTPAAEVADPKLERAVRRLTQGSLPWNMLRFGAPLVVGMFLYTTFNLIDMFMISRLENAKAALAALGLCDMVAALPTIISNGISTSTVAILARRLGEGDHAGIRRVTAQSLLLVGAFSLFFGLLGLFGAELIVTGVMQAKGEVATLATAYLRVMIGGAFAIFFLLQITAILRALGRSKSAAALLVSGNLINILLNLLLVYGPGPTPEVFAWAQPLAVALGTPRMGLQGAAWATLLGRALPVLFGLGLLVYLLRRRDRQGESLWSALAPDPATLKSLIVLGWPSSAQLVVRIGAILVFLSLINSNYTTEGDAHTLTAYSICLRLETLVLFLGMGWGAAASSFIGTNLGKGDRRRAHLAGWLAAGYNAVVAGGLVLLFLAYAEPILGFFEGSPDVLASGRTYLEHVAPSYVLVAVGVVLLQAMSGAGATLLSLALDASALLLLVIPASIVVTERMQAPPEGLWTTIALGNAVAALAFAVAYTKGRFLDKKV